MVAFSPNIGIGSLAAFPKATNRLIKSLPEKGFTVLVVSHDMHQIFDIADRILIMRNGEIIEDVMKSETTPMELIERISGE